MKIETENPILHRVASVRTSRIPNSWGAKGISCLSEIKLPVDFSILYGYIP
ncbi:MAG: hypothetical protein AABY33_01755 [Pseudomonadota bacterium]|mgnify:CR=1 FL=1